MYNDLKTVLKKILPKKILFRLEPYLRPIYYLFFKGKKFQCNICKKKLRKFISLNNNDSLCPYCGSISRSRRLWDLLNSEFIKANISVLDFSPHRTIYRNLKKNNSISYTGTDLSGDFISDIKLDITNIDAKAETYDLIICYHILEHIEDDVKAMNELNRILKKDGICIIQTPFKEGETYENPLIKTDKERIKHFGQKDHVRIYSVKGLKERLAKCGFKAEILNFEENDNNKFGFKKNETILICTK